jgi:hypothetical protein
MNYFSEGKTYAIRFQPSKNDGLDIYVNENNENDEADAITIYEIANTKPPSCIVDIYKLNYGRFSSSQMQALGNQILRNIGY